MSEQREELLKRWAKEAPGECRAETNRYGTQVWVRHGGAFRFQDDPVSALDKATQLSALIEAIRARGWHYNLFSDETEKGNEEPAAWHSASIYGNRENVVPKTTAERSEPCDALLSAYVQALEATQEN